MALAQPEVVGPKTLAGEAAARPRGVDVITPVPLALVIVETTDVFQNVGHEAASLLAGVVLKGDDLAAQPVLLPLGERRRHFRDKVAEPLEVEEQAAVAQVAPPLEVVGLHRAPPFSSGMRTSMATGKTWASPWSA